MTLSFGLLLIWASFAGRYGRRLLGDLMIWIHLVMVFLGVLLAVIGFLLAIVYTANAHKSQFSAQGGHRIIGLLLLIILLLQLALGVLVRCCGERESADLPLWPNIVHSIVAFVLALGGFLNMYLGLSMLCVGTLAAAALGVLFITVVATFVVLEMLSWSSEWGGWLTTPADWGRSIDDNAPKLLLRIGFAVAFLVCLLAAILMLVGIMTTKQSDSPTAFYHNCQQGTLSPDGNWWTYLICGVLLAVAAAAMVFVFWLVNRCLSNGPTQADYELSL